MSGDLTFVAKSALLIIVFLRHGSNATDVSIAQILVKGQHRKLLNQIVVDFPCLFLLLKIPK